MDTYQRGNRDGLLAFAAECDEEAARQEAEGRKWETSRHNAGLRTAEMYYARSGVLSAVARTARRRAEALPLDPEAS
jgi:hypothetical protein